MEKKIYQSPVTEVLNYGIFENLLQNVNLEEGSDNSYTNTPEAKQWDMEEEDYESLLNVWEN